MSKSTPISQLPGAAQQATQLQPPPTPQGAYDDANDDTDTLREVYNHLNGEAPQRMMAPPPPSASMQAILAPPTQPPQQPYQYQYPPPAAAPLQPGYFRQDYRPQYATEQPPQWMRELKVAAVMAALFFVISVLPIAPLLDRYLPVLTRVAYSEQALKAVACGVAFTLGSRFVPPP